MTYKDWEDREMYATPMFSMVETGETEEERIMRAAKTLKDLSGFEKEMKKTCAEYPVSASEHIGSRCGTLWLVKATLYRLEGITLKEFRKVRNASLTDGEFKRLCDTAERINREWLGEHPFS